MVGDQLNFYITGLQVQFTTFNFTCKMLVVTISSRCSSDIHRNDVTFIFLSLQNRLTLRALSPRDSVGGNVSITSQKFRYKGNAKRYNSYQERELGVFH